MSASAVEGSVFAAAVKAFCGPKMRVAASVACDALREILPGGVDDNEVDDLDDAITQLNDAYSLAPATT
jgi:hypothetical protein